MINEWGGSGIEKVTFDYITSRISHGSIFVELGAGRVSTREFCKVFSLYSVEQNSEYCGIYPGTNYIHAPIRNGWYDTEILKRELPKNISGIFVDGPAGSGNRNGLLANIDLFDMTDDVIIVFHDTYRDEELKLAQKMADQLGMKISLFTEGDYFAILSKT
jgi:hypothetical protein